MVCGHYETLASERATSMRSKRSHNQKVADLMSRLSGLDNTKPKGPAEMRTWLRERRWVKTALEAIGPPR